MLEIDDAAFLFGAESCIVLEGSDEQALETRRFGEECDEFCLSAFVKKKRRAVGVFLSLFKKSVHSMVESSEGWAFLLGGQEVFPEFFEQSFFEELAVKRRVDHTVNVFGLFESEDIVSGDS